MYRINTNVASLNAQTYSNISTKALQSSLGRLSSGLRINAAADDASGMSIADSLRSQSGGLQQAINNANDAIGIVQTADRAMDEQIKILDIIKQKAIQSAQDAQNKDSRTALQADINRLLEELDNIAITTAFNGQQLLNGTFFNKSFQIGSYSNEIVQVSIGATESSKIGHTRFQTTGNTAFSSGFISQAKGSIVLKISGIDGMPSGFALEEISADELMTKGLAGIAKRINEASDETGVKAVVNNSNTQIDRITAGNIKGLVLNGVLVGDLNIQDGDEDGVLRAAINAKTHLHGVTATVDRGILTLNAAGGRAIQLTSNQPFRLAREVGLNRLGFRGNSGFVFLGQLTFIRQDARDIKIIVSSHGFTLTNRNSRPSSGLSMTTRPVGISTAAINVKNGMVGASVSLKTLNSTIIPKPIARALGAYNPLGFSGTNQLRVQLQGPIAGGVITYVGAQALIDVAQTAQKTLDKIRSDLGSVQNQLLATINNISVTAVNIKASESQIRDVDFASESANFSKNNILVQSGAYAMAQANSSQQHILRLLE